MAVPRRRPGPLCSLLLCPLSEEPLPPCHRQKRSRRKKKRRNASNDFLSSRAGDFFFLLAAAIAAAGRSLGHQAIGSELVPLRDGAPFLQVGRDRIDEIRSTSSTILPRSCCFLCIGTAGFLVLSASLVRSTGPVLSQLRPRYTTPARTWQADDPPISETIRSVSGVENTCLTNTPWPSSIFSQLDREAASSVLIGPSDKPSTLEHTTLTGVRHHRSPGPFATTPRRWSEKHTMDASFALCSRMPFAKRRHWTTRSPPSFPTLISPSISSRPGGGRVWWSVRPEAGTLFLGASSDSIPSTVDSPVAAGWLV